MGASVGAAAARLRRTGQREVPQVILGLKQRAKQRCRDNRGRLRLSIRVPNKHPHPFAAPARPSKERRGLHRLSSHKGSHKLGETVALVRADRQLLLAESARATSACNGGGTVGGATDDLSVVGEGGVGEADGDEAAEY